MARHLIGNEIDNSCAGCIALRLHSTYALCLYAASVAWNQLHLLVPSFEADCTCARLEVTA